MAALGVIGSCDLVGAIPRKLVLLHGPRFGLAHIEMPLPQPQAPIQSIASKAALVDAGVAWLWELLKTLPAAAGNET
jgi:hypothetical protein